jgi:hypothetical protein
MLPPKKPLLPVMMNLIVVYTSVDSHIELAP